MSCHLRIGDFEFTPEEIERAAREKGLLSIEIEFNLSCSFRCRYCYNQVRSDDDAHLTPDEGRSAIRQARELGARKVIVLGGEPMLYPSILEMLAYIRDEGMAVEMFTNGSRVDRDMARRLFELGVRVVLKRNSFRPEVQDDLAGRPGAHRVIENAYRNLREAGYPSADRILAISTVVCRQNADEIPRLWEWMRTEGLAPYVEVLTPHGGIADWQELSLNPNENQRVFEQLAAWDRTHLDLHWEPQPPLVGNRCLRHVFSCLICADGTVKPCVGVSIPVGNIRERPLGEILNESEVLHDLRNYRQTIKGPCGVCPRSESCYGCRGSAYQETGDYLASDPRCWRNRDRQVEIQRMPAPAAPLIPQKDPMRLIDSLCSVGERVATVGVTVRPEMPFVDGEGCLSEAAFLEMIAQATAAMGGFRRPASAGKDPGGMILGARNLEILGTARVGDYLEIEVFKSNRLGPFGIIQGHVRREQEVLARGEIKILQFEGPAPDAVGRIC